MYICVYCISHGCSQVYKCKNQRLATIHPSNRMMLREKKRKSERERERERHCYVPSSLDQNKGKEKEKPSTLSPFMQNND